MIDIQIKKEDRKITYYLIGKLNSEASKDFKDLIKDIEQEADEIILDFSGLKYISSAGIRIILEIYKLTKEKNIKLSITNVSPNNMDVLETTGLRKYLNIILNG